MAYDLGAVNVCVLLGLMLRFDGALPDRYLGIYAQFVFPYSTLSLLVFFLNGLYHRLWQFASIGELWVILRAVLMQSMLFAALVLWYPAARGFPRSVVIFTGALVLLAVGGFRLLWRMTRYLDSVTRGRGAGHRRVLIVGAGEAGATVVKELRNHPEVGMFPVGIVDDDPRKRGLRLHGVKVIGCVEELPKLAEEHDPNEVVFAIPSAPPSKLREVMGHCQRLGLKLKTMPGLYELLGGRVTVDHIRPVQLEDLLGRKPVELNLEQIAGYLGNQTVLVTGAGGSIGSELCRQVARFRPELLVLLDHDENGVFETALTLDADMPDVRKKIVIADIRDRTKIAHVFATYKPSITFHAAAHKHVPLMEEHPDEAIKTNVLGTRNVAEAAREHGCKHFVLISTDKAVNPTSVMGASKRLAEITVLGMNGDDCGTRFVAVRFGNVIGSRGSVVPIFQAQIARGGPVTVTHPEMTRYFMTTPEAVQLVIQAAAMGKGGEIFALDMGEPVKIVDLAENMIRLSGYEPGKDIPIVFTGIRPGERLSESVFSGAESLSPTAHPRIWQADGLSGQPEHIGQLLAEGLQSLERLLFGSTTEVAAGRLERELHALVAYPVRAAD